VTNPEGVVPQEQTKLGSNGYALTLPSFRDSVRTLDQTVEVDYYLPGCPPPVKLIVNAVTAILENKLPPKGTVLAPDKALCEECPRKPTKPDKLALKELKRPHQTLIDPEKCLLAQGLLCLGPATRSGCGAPCVSANMPCTGCLGPTSRVKDYGAKALSAIASLIDSEDEREIAALMEQIVDPVGTFYRYSLPASLLHRRIRNLSSSRRKPAKANSPDKSGRRCFRMTREIVIDPITRLEGHGKIDIFLDAKGNVERAFFQVPELRGFEKFAVGRPAEDMPQITSRICGVCPTAHHMAATKALDDLYKVEPPSAAKKISEIGV
jgi:coenzyme F420-reducing hydrogenase gamma subunit